MAMLDWIAVALLVLSTLVGMSRGLLFEAVSMVGWIAAFVLAQWLGTDVGRWLPLGAPDAPWRDAVGFVLVFVVAAFGCGWVAALVRKLVSVAGLRPVDRVLGGVFGLVRAIVVMLVAGVLVHLFVLNDRPWWRESASATAVGVALHRLKPMVPDKLASYFP